MLGIFHCCCVNSEAVIALLGTLPNIQQFTCCSLKTEIQKKVIEVRSRATLHNCIIPIQPNGRSHHLCIWRCFRFDIHD